MLRRLVHETGGGVAIITALAGAAILGVAALGVDLGAVYLQSRQLQGIADLAAISGANDLGRARSAVAATAALNGWPDGTVQVKADVGVYRPNSKLTPARRFTPGGSHPNAVRVTLSAPLNSISAAPSLAAPI